MVKWWVPLTLPYWWTQHEHSLVRERCTRQKKTIVWSNLSMSLVVFVVPNHFNQICAKLIQCIVTTKQYSHAEYATRLFWVLGALLQQITHIVRNMQSSMPGHCSLKREMMNLLHGKPTTNTGFRCAYLSLTICWDSKWRVLIKDKEIS